MNFSLALTNLILGVSLTLSNASDPADLVRDSLGQSLVSNGMEDTHRRLDELHTDFSDFVGTWMNCLHTTLMTFNGEPAEKHIVDQVGCDYGEFGVVKKVGNNAQTMQFDIFLLNHCFFHGLGGEGEPPCPDDFLASDDRGAGNVLVKYSFAGIGSFAHANRIEFTSDHTYLRDEDGEWVPNLERAKIENADTLVCETYLEGIVCDWRITEFRTATEEVEKGCKSSKTDECTSAGRRKCSKNKGTWTTECSTTKSIKNGFVYDSFGSYYLVKDLSQCSVECATSSPTESGATKSPELRIPGCYTGGCCGGQHGCCDCAITEDECPATEGAPGTWLNDGCGGICNSKCA